MRPFQRVDGLAVARDATVHPLRRALAVLGVSALMSDAELSRTLGVCPSQIARYRRRPSGMSPRQRQLVERLLAESGSQLADPLMQTIAQSLHAAGDV